MSSAILVVFCCLIIVINAAFDPFVDDKAVIVSNGFDDHEIATLIRDIVEQRRLRAQTPTMMFDYGSRHVRKRADADDDTMILNLPLRFGK
jgi:hypothetical protein